MNNKLILSVFVPESNDNDGYATIINVEKNDKGYVVIVIKGEDVETILETTFRSKAVYTALRIAETEC